VEDFTGKSPEGFVQLWPEVLASDVENFAKMFKEEDNLNTLLKGLDVTTSIWKGTVLYLPRWTVVNVIGSGILGMLAGSNPLTWPKHFKEYYRAVGTLHGLGFGEKNMTKFSNVLHKIGDESLSMREIMQEAVLDRVANSGRWMQEILVPAQLSGGRGAATNFLAKVMTAKNPAGAALMKWFKYNAFVEDIFRVMVWADLRAQGLSRAESAGKVARYMFDYGDLSYVEKRWGTRLWPFYRWMRNNSAFQIKKSLESPRYASAYPKLLNSLYEGFEDEGEYAAGVAAPMDAGSVGD
jgi:hypothetical protein